MTAPRWEIRRTDAGYHVAFVASNGETVVNGETLSSREDAVAAIESVVGRRVVRMQEQSVILHANLDPRTQPSFIDVADVDERGKQ